MRRLFDFWQKDIINKLIVLVLILITAAVIVQAYWLAATPAGKLLVGRFYPTPTLSVEDLFLVSQATSTAKAQQTAAAIVPTITTMPFTPMPQFSATPTSTAAAPSAPAITHTVTPLPIYTSTPEPTVSEAVAAGENCLPEKPAQVGKVLEVVDGNTVRVMIEELVYTVRYIGVEVPEDATFAQLSAYKNGELVYAKEVQLFADGPDTDDSNRLRRYVVMDDMLVNQEMIRLGLATIAEPVPPFRCASTFSAAEQAAKKDLAGLWKAAQP